MEMNYCMKLCLRFIKMLRPHPTDGVVPYVLPAAITCSHGVQRGGGHRRTEPGADRGHPGPAIREEEQRPRRGLCGQGRGCRAHSPPRAHGGAGPCAGEDLVPRQPLLCAERDPDAEFCRHRAGRGRAQVQFWGSTPGAGTPLPRRRLPSNPAASPSAC